MKTWLEQLRTPSDRVNLYQWFIGLRWIVAALQFLALVPAYRIGLVDSSSIWRYIAVMASVPLVNLALLRHGPHSPDECGKAGGWILGGLCFDLIQLSILLAMTGGWNNPFSSLVFVYGILAALALSRWQRFLFAGLLVTDIILLSKVFRREISQVLPWTELFADTAVEVVVAISLMVISGSLVGKVLQQERKVSHLIGARLRMDRLRAIGALSSGVCHQLATPLNNLSIRVGSLRRQLGSMGDEDLIGSLDSMDQSLKKALAALRRLADIQVDPEASEFVPVDLGELFKDLVKTWIKSSPHPMISLHHNNFPSVVVPVPIGAITQVVLDLLDNGAEAMDECEGIVCLDMHHDNDFIYISVRDSGSGFPQEVIRYLGEPFNSQKPGGSGLGLYHAKLISHLLGGTLQVENLEEGAIVTLTISRRPLGT